MTLTQKRLKEVLSYDPKTGHFYWLKAWGRRRMNVPAGCYDKRDGYILIGIDGVVYRANRLVWLYVYGKFPTELLDHKNQDSTDNRLENLREASQSQNLCNRGAQVNNTSGLKGAHVHGRSGKWYARITVDGKTHRLGLYDTAKKAHAAYCAAAKRLHGDFARTT